MDTAMRTIPETHRGVAQGAGQWGETLFGVGEDLQPGSGFTIPYLQHSGAAFPVDSWVNISPFLLQIGSVMVIFG
jgi:hypothetical protein